MGKRKRRKQMRQQLELTSMPPQPSTKQKEKMSTNTSIVKMKQLRDMPGIMTCMFEHDVVNTTVKYKFEGPQMKREMWNEVLAFFRWTNSEFRSESQVRMFVHPQHGWKAWAFPQKARTGMTAHEINEGEEGYAVAQKQRKQFNPDEGWRYFCTVHHHCSMGAFQSSTDENNEKGQDGIHITMGNMDAKDKYSIDVRMYYCGYKLGGFDMSQFWDIGNELDCIPAHLRSLLPDNVKHMAALRQMCIPPPDDATFNEVWKTNIIEPPKPKPIEVSSIPAGGYPPDSYSPGSHSHVSHTPGATHGQWNHGMGVNGESRFKGKYRNGWRGDSLYSDRCFPAYSTDLDSCLLDIKAWMCETKYPFYKQMASVLQFFERIEPIDACEIELIELMLRNDCNLPALLDHLTRHVVEEEEIEAEEEARLGGGGLMDAELDAAIEQEKKDALDALERELASVPKPEEKKDESPDSSIPYGHEGWGY